MFASPNAKLQWEALSSRGEWLVASSSKLGGNDWPGELRVFRYHSSSSPFDTVGAARLEFGSACNQILTTTTNTPELVVACGQDDGAVRLFSLKDDDGLCPSSHVISRRHEDVVSCLAAGGGSSGGRLASGSWDKTVMVHDVANGGGDGSALEHLRCCRDLITGVAFLGDVIAMGEMGGRVLARDVRERAGNERVLVNLAGTTTLTALLASATDGLLVMGCGDGTVRQVDTRRTTHTEEVLRRHRGAVHALAVDDDGRRILSGADDGTVMLGGEDNIVVAAQAKDFVRGVAFWGETGVCSSWDGQLRLIS